LFISSSVYSCRIYHRFTLPFHNPRPSPCMLRTYLRMHATGIQCYFSGSMDPIEESS
jgi:hypothetical protein